MNTSTTCGAAQAAVPPAPPALTGNDRGSTSLAIVLTTPIVVVLMFLGVQAAMWNHTRTETRVVARETAVLVARDGVGAAQAEKLAVDILRRDALLSSPVVKVTVGVQAVIVTISGNAPGILRGTTRPVSVRVALAREGWVPL